MFVDEERSYAERTGQANGDMGWIRVLAFEERRPVAWFERARAQATARRRARWPRRRRPARARVARCEAPGQAQAPVPGADRVQKGEASAPRAAEKSLAEGLAPGRRSPTPPGTGWGERRQDPVRETWFVAAATPGDHLVFRYEYASSLRALGIDLDGDRLWDRERGELGFAKPPKW